MFHPLPVHRRNRSRSRQRSFEDHVIAAPIRPMQIPARNSAMSISSASPAVITADP
jgi:hypothetical protein